MSSDKIIQVHLYKVIDFISIEHGIEFITFTVFKGSPAESMSIHLTPDQADEIATELIMRSDKIRSSKL